MLRFGSGLGGRRPADADEQVPSPRARTRVLPQSQVYPSGLAPSPALPGEAANVVAVRKVLADGAFHPVSDLVRSVEQPSELVAALGELLVTGRALDVSGGRVRMRYRERGEAPVPLLEVVRGLDFSAPCRKDPVRPAVTERRRPPSREAETVVPVGLALSDPPADLTIPLEWVPGMTSAILATRGVGKTYLAGVMVEELRAKTPDTRIVVLDPTGASWGLAATAGGAPSDLGVLLLGGERGVQPLNARSGRALAELAGELGPRVIVCDLFGMSKSESHALAADFFERVQVMPAFPLHVVLDEADIFVPQQFGALGGDQKRCSEMAHEYFLRGRRSGRGGTVVSLRPAVVSKSILSVVEGLFLLRLGESHDLRAVETWLASYEHGVSEEHRRECLGQLPVLPRGTAYFLRGGEEATFRRFRVRPKRTFDSSRTLGSAGAAASARCARTSDADLARVREIFAGGSRAGGEGE